MSSSKNFFKIIICSNLHDHKLRLPDKFVKKHGDELSDFVKLIVPAGGIWCVGVEKTEKSIWLHEGMKNFMEDHCIQLGYFLFFKYKGDSTFKIRILNLSSFEIEYPNTCDSARPLDEEDDNGPHEKIVDEDKDDSSIEIWGSSIDHNDRLRPKRCYLTRNKKQKIQSETVPVSSSEVNSKTTTSTNRKKSLEKKPIQEANISLAKNPCYSVVIKSYNISNSTVLSLPNEFARLYMSNPKMLVKLQDDDGNEWEVRCIRTRNCLLSQGWRSFVKEKNLMVGDVCVFEPIRINEQVKLKVKISRANESAPHVN